MYQDYIESIEIIDDVIRDDNDINTLIPTIVKNVIEIFKCERCWIIYPCDPKASTWQAVCDEAISPLIPKFEINVDHPTTTSVSDYFKKHIESAEPLVSLSHETLNVPGGAHFIQPRRSQLSIAIKPKSGEGWLIAIEQCHFERSWEEIEQKLFKHISKRINDALNNIFYAKELTKSKDNLNSLLKKLPDLILELDIDANIISSNKPLKNNRPNLNYRSHISEALSVSQIEELDFAIKKIKSREEEKITFELPLVPVNANEIHILSHLIMPIRKSGKVIGFLLIVTDVTEQRRSQDALTRLNNSLERRIGLEVDISRQKDHLMFQQSRLASMGEMIGNIAHQWRQPLSSLSAIIQNIRHKSDRDKLNREFLENITEDALKIASQMSDTIDDFRNFFEPSKAKERFNVNKAIEDTLELLMPTLLNNDIKTINNQNINIDILGYKNELSQTVLNIFSNAKDIIIEKVQRSRIIMIEISLSKNNRHVVISIQDNGGGIPENIIDNIFDPYFTTKEQGKGTGIGLYMSKQIIETNMKGNILVKNSTFEHEKIIYKGAQFTIELPLTLR